MTKGMTRVLMIIVAIMTMSLGRLNAQPKLNLLSQYETNNEIIDVLFISDKLIVSTNEDSTVLCTQNRISPFDSVCVFPLQQTYIPQLSCYLSDGNRVSLLEDSCGQGFFSWSLDTALGQQFQWPTNYDISVITDMMMVGNLTSGALIVYICDSFELLIWPITIGSPISNVPMFFTDSILLANPMSSFQPDGDSALWIFQSNVQMTSINWKNGLLQVRRTPLILPSIDSCSWISFYIQSTLFMASLNNYGNLRLWKQGSGNNTFSNVISNNNSFSESLKCKPQLNVQTVANDAFIVSQEENQKLNLWHFYIDGLHDYPYIEHVMEQVLFEAENNFHLSTQYRSNIIYEDGDSMHFWQFRFAGVVTTHVIQGDYSLQLYAPNGSILDYPYAEQLYDIDSVHEVSFRGFAYPGNDKQRLLLQYSTDGGINYQGDSLYTMTNTVSLYRYKIPTLTNGIRLRFTLIPRGESTGVRIVNIDELSFLFFAENRNLVPPNVTESQVGLHYIPYTISLNHPNENVQMFYSKDSVSASLLSSTLYESPILIEQSLQLQCFAYSSGYNISPIVTKNIVFESMDTLLSMSESRTIPLIHGLKHYFIKCDLPVVFANDNCVYIDNGHESLRLMGKIGQDLHNGDVIEEMIGEAHLSAYNMAYYDIKWIGDIRGDNQVEPQVMRIDTLTNKHLFRFVRINNLIFPHNLMFSKTDALLGACIVNDANGDSIVLRNYLLQLDGIFSSVFRYDVIGILGSYGGKLNLYPLVMIPTLGSCVEHSEELSWYIDNLQLHVQCSKEDVIELYLITGEKVYTGLCSTIIDLSPFSMQSILIMYVNGVWYKIVL